MPDVSSSSPHPRQDEEADKEARKKQRNMLERERRQRETADEKKQRCQNRRDRDKYQCVKITDNTLPRDRNKVKCRTQVVKRRNAMTDKQQLALNENRRARYLNRKWKPNAELNPNQHNTERASPHQLRHILLEGTVTGFEKPHSEVEVGIPPASKKCTVYRDGQQPKYI